MSLIRTIIALGIIASSVSVLAAEKKNSSGVLDDLGRDLKKSAASVERDLERTGKKAKTEISEAGESIEKTVKKNKAEAIDSAKKAKEKTIPKKNAKKDTGVKKPNPVSSAFTKVKNKGKSIVDGVRGKLSKKDPSPNGEEKNPKKTDAKQPAPVPKKK